MNSPENSTNNHIEDQEPFPTTLFVEMLQKIKHFDELVNSVDPKTYRYNEGTISGDETYHFVRFLKDNENILKQALQQESFADQALEALKTLTNFSDWSNKDNMFNNDVVKYAFSAIEKLQPEIEEAIKSKPERIHLALDVYQSLMRRGDDLRELRGAAFIAGHLPEIEEIMLIPDEVVWNENGRKIDSLQQHEKVRLFLKLEDLLKFGSEGTRYRTPGA